LNTWQVDAIDVVPGKYFPDPAGNRTRNNFCTAILARSRDLVGGHAVCVIWYTGLNLFADSVIQQKMLNHLQAVSRIIAARYSCILFGSPKNRDRQGLNDDLTLEIATDFFRRLGDCPTGRGDFLS
jgi:hypothetical protein